MAQEATNIISDKILLNNFLRKKNLHSDNMQEGTNKILRNEVGKNFNFDCFGT